MFSLVLIEGQAFTPEPFVKDLGIILDCKLSFNRHIITSMSSLSGSLSSINRVRHLLLLVILNSLGFLSLLYCSPVWAGTPKQDIKKLLLKGSESCAYIARQKDYLNIRLCRISSNSVSLGRDWHGLITCISGILGTGS